MRKSVLITRDEKGLSIQPVEGFLNTGVTIPARGSKELILGIFGLLGIGEEYIVILRKRGKKCRTS